MRSDDISPDIIGTPLSGERDIGMRVGVILSWNELTGANLVDIEGQEFEDLKIVQNGIGIQYQSGDVVVVMRNKTTYFILGKVTAPGASAANQIQGQFILASESTTSTTQVDLPTFGPSVSVNIGSTRRCLILSSCFMSASATNLGAYYGGNMRITMNTPSGVTTTNSVGLFKSEFGPSTVQSAFQEDLTRAQLLTAADGVEIGPHTFTAQYRAVNGAVSCLFASRNLVAIPF